MPHFLARTKPFYKRQPLIDYLMCRANCRSADELFHLLREKRSVRDLAKGELCSLNAFQLPLGILNEADWAINPIKLSRIEFINLYNT